MAPVETAQGAVRDTTVHITGRKYTLMLVTAFVGISAMMNGHV